MSPAVSEDHERVRGSGSGAKPGLAPHPVLSRHYPSESDRPAYLKGLFDASARHYDWINQILSLGTGVRYRREALLRAGLAPGMSVIDVACGTGVISEQAALLVGSAGQVISVDPSRGMRDEALRKRGIEAIDGTAERLPLPDASTDFLVMGYALRHVADLLAAFRQFARVLRPGGRLLLLEITAPESGAGRGLLRFYLRAVIPCVMRLGSRSAAAQELMVYHWDSIQNCVRPPTILSAMGRAGLSDCRRRVELGIFSEYTAVRP
jgi:demethylmenaquinone methyltransferase/2-methoxy-6-polyprenyl-1,4-benzoquinol methylase